ncbi:restriction endonuclease subunit S [Thiothrix eikelboomii]|uniref:restriction endonuclease subunit S n=1 Tax=Thiothrix eikelboomii TaxID=92487 RepID=UPI003BAEC0A7
MTKPEKKALVPALRFPEFWNKPEWKKTKLGDVCDMQAGKFVRASEIKDKTADGLYPCYEGNGLRGFTETFTHNGKYSLIGRQGALCGNITLATDKFHATEHAVVVIPKEGVSTPLLYYMLIYLDLNQFATGQAQPGLSVENLEKVPLSISPEEDEQQKIADCLTSLDDLITAETQKLAALKANKKGLMQQLFPAEGETVPKLRFPEFRDAGEWEEKRLIDVCEKIMDGTHFSPQSKSGSRLYLTSKNIQNGIIDLSNISYISEEDHRKIYEKCPVKKNDVLLTKDGANTGNCAINSIDFEFSLLSSVAVLRGKALIIDHRFLYQLVLSDQTQKIIQESMSGQAITRITLQKIGGFLISMTSIEEQQKIADCLSSIDELITAQGEKIDALKLHKKGLMQQLFPVMEEVDA